MNFTDSQKEVLTLALEGREATDNYLPAIRELVRLGLITSRKVRMPAYPATPGGMVWHTWQQTAYRTMYRVTLTEDGRTELGVLF